MATRRRRDVAPLAVPDEIVREAKKDRLLGPRVYLNDRRRVALMCDGAAVGFVTPHETASGWRAGPIFVLPEFRGRGLVEAFYAARADRTWVAFIPSEKKASLAMHTRAGFVKWKSSHHGLWMRKDASK